MPLRAAGAVRYNGAFYGQTGHGDPLPELITADALIGLIAGLEPGTTEIACHPGLDPDLDSPYRSERLREVQALCDPRVAAAIAEAGIALVGYRDLG